MLRLIVILVCISSLAMGQTKKYSQEPHQVDTNIYITVDQMPIFGKGNYDLQKYIAENIIYPLEVSAKKISGTVQVQFVIDRDGKPIDIHILRSAHSMLDEEAVRVIQSMPKWKPGYKHGVPVKVQCTLPIVFMSE